MNTATTKPCHCCQGSGTEADQAQVGAAMRSLRLARGLSLRDLARKLKLSAPYLSDLERGHRKWSEALIESYQRTHKNKP